MSAEHHHSNHEDHTMKTIILTLKDRRAARGWSQEKLAPALGVSSRTLGAWERDEKTPTPQHLEAWAALLGLEFSLKEKAVPELPVPGAFTAGRLY